MTSRDGSEDFMPAWPMAMPSVTVMVQNSRGVPPDGGDPKLDRLGLAHQRDIAGRGFVPAGRDADEGLMDLLAASAPSRNRTRGAARARRLRWHAGWAAADFKSVLASIEHLTGRTGPSPLLPIRRQRHLRTGSPAAFARPPSRGHRCREILWLKRGVCRWLRCGKMKCSQRCCSWGHNSPAACPRR